MPVNDADEPGVGLSVGDSPNRTVTLVLFMLVNFISYYDRGAIAGSLSTLKSDPELSKTTLSDAKAGALVSAFMIGFMIFSPIFASLGGLLRPSYIVALGLAVWCLAAIGSAASVSYGMLLTARCLVGVGEAAYCGFIPSMIDDMAPDASRTMYIGMYFAMIPVGTAAGMAAGGVLSTYDDILGTKGWKFVFASEAVLMMLLIVFVLRLPRTLGLGKGKAAPAVRLERSAGVEAVRAALNGDSCSESSASLDPGADGPDEYPGPIAAVRSLARNPMYLLTVLGYGMYTFVVGGTAAWGIIFLEQGQLRMDKSAASLGFGMTTAVSGIIGTAAGGWYVDKIGGSKGLMGMLKCHKLNILMTLISVPCGLLAFMMSNTPLFFTLCFLAEVALFVTTAPINAVVLESVSESMRTYAMSFSIFIIHAIGDFPSPILVGAVSDHFSEGCARHDNDTDHVTGRDFCDADVEHSCVWFDDGSVCRNIHQLRNAMIFVFILLVCDSHPLPPYTPKI